MPDVWSRKNRFGLMGDVFVGVFWWWMELAAFLSDWQLHSDFQGGDTNRDGPPAWLCLIPHLAFICTSLSIFYPCASSSGARSHPSRRSLPQRSAVGRKTIPNHGRLGESVNAQDNLRPKLERSHSLFVIVNDILNAPSSLISAIAVQS